MRTKVLAATLLVAGAIGSVAERWFSRRPSAAAARGRSSGSGLVGSRCPGRRRVSSRSGRTRRCGWRAFPSGQGGPAVGGAFGGQQPGGGGRGGSGEAGSTRGGGRGGEGGMPGMGMAAHTWEYKFVDIRNDRMEFERTITQHGKDGWEYCSSERNLPPDRSRGTGLVFKKQKGGTAHC